MTSKMGALAFELISSTSAATECSTRTSDSNSKEVPPVAVLGEENDVMVIIIPKTIKSNRQGRLLGFRLQAFELRTALESFIMMVCKIPSLLLLLTAHHGAMANLDLAFIIDTSESMASDLVHFKNAINGIVADTQGLGTNVRYGLASFEDYPILPLGGDGDEPYRRNIDLTTSTSAFSTSVGNLAVADGNDRPGSQLVAIRQLLVGTPQTVDDFAVSEERMHFRDDARKIIILWTDTPFQTPERNSAYPGPNFVSVIANLDNSTVDPGYVFVGLNPDSDEDTTSDLQRLATATGTFATTTVDCGAGEGPDIGTGQLLVCTKVGGSVAAVRQGFVNSIRDAVPPIPAPTPDPAPAPVFQTPVPFCFSVSNTVVELHRGTILIDQLRVGDYVETASGSFSKVFSLAHMHRDVESDFLQIFTDPPTKRPLEITPDHLIFVNGTPQRASTVRTGDTLNTGLTVVRVDSIKRKGLYAPLTESGELLVTGVRVSSYVDVLDGAAVANQHMLGHLALTPVRLFCRGWSEFCAAETHDIVVGYSRLYGWVLRLIVWARLLGGPVVTWLGSVVVALLMLPLWTMEELMLLRASSSSVSLLLAIVAGAWVLRRRGSPKVCKSIL